MRLADLDRCSKHKSGRGGET